MEVKFLYEKNVILYMLNIFVCIRENEETNVGINLIFIFRFCFIVFIALLYTIDKQLG